MSLLPDGKDVLDAMSPRAGLITDLAMEKLNPAERVALIYPLRKISEDDEVRIMCIAPNSSNGMMP
ncbi:MAG TPA: hypothetical protein VN112_18270 [Ensifer sp.]|nr:hypothetical protein [Ensifer sp.]